MTRPPRTGPRVVALGGGHGLAATLRALRRVTDDITAIVGVSDDGGSSGRLRRELGVIPPGDLRMALAALCGDDAWGRTWSRVVQHRFGGAGELAGHALGNLIISALWEETSDIVTGLDWVGSLLGAHGRVLPLALEPLDIVAEVSGMHPIDPQQRMRVRGQVAVATTPGQVERITLEPADVASTPQALAALQEADAIVLGPGSWYTSVIPHLLLPDMRQAIADAAAMRLVVLNLGTQSGETEHFHPHTHLDVLHEQAPELRLDVVLADTGFVSDRDALERSARRLGARLELTNLAEAEGVARHHPDLFAAALRPILPPRGGPHGRMRPWP